MSSGGDNRDEGDERTSPNKRPRIRYNNASPPLSVQRLLRQDVQAYLQETQQAQPADPMWSPRRPGTGRRPGQPAQPRPTLNLPMFQPSTVDILRAAANTNSSCQDPGRESRACRRFCRWDSPSLSTAALRRPGDVASPRLGRPARGVASHEYGRRGEDGL